MIQRRPPGMRRSRMGIPAVNQNPRPPGEVRYSAQTQANPNMRTGIVHGGGALQGQNQVQGNQPQGPHQSGIIHGGPPGGGGGPNGPQHPGNWLQTHLNTFWGNVNKHYKPPGFTYNALDPNQLANQFSNPTAVTPDNLFAFSSFAPRAGQPDPRDSGYWSNLTNLLQASQQKYAAGVASQTQADTAYGLNQTYGQEGYRQAQQRLAQQMARRGLSASGALDEAGAQLTGSYGQQTSDAAIAKGIADQARAGNQSGILQGFQSGEGQLASDAAARYAALQGDRSARDQGLLTPQQAAQLNKIERRAQVLRNRLQKNRGKK